MVDFCEKAKKFPSNGAKAKGITRTLMEMIAVDDQTLSIVDDVGFRGFVAKLEARYTFSGRKYLSDICLPDLYDVVANHIYELLATYITAISFTTDIWSSDVSVPSMLV